MIGQGADDLLRRLIMGEQQRAGDGVQGEEIFQRVLDSIDTGSSIPHEAYAIVAELVSFLYNCDRELAAAKPSAAPFLVDKV